MKEIDFLPTWYKNDQKRTMYYRTQYCCIALMLTLMLVWSFVIQQRINHSEQEVVSIKPEYQECESLEKEHADLNKQIEDCRKRADLLKSIDSKIRISNVLGELGYLLNSKVVLSKLEFLSDSFGTNKLGPNKINAIRKIGATGDQQAERFVGDVRFKIVIDGRALDSGDVAELICSLEDSPYFRHVIPSYSRNIDLKLAEENADAKASVSEFEISCYLANYKEESSYVSNGSSSKVGLVY